MSQQTGQPAAGAPQDDVILNYQCPNCAAPLAFGIESQQWDCHFCNSSFSKEQIDALQAQGGGAPPEPAWETEGEAFGESEAVAYTCPSCGGRVLTDQNTAATFCPYCHNPTVIAARLSGEYRPAELIPFMQTREQAVAALQKLCKGKPFLPPVFKEIARKGEVAGLYVPYWLYGANYNVLMHANAQRVHTWRDSNYIYTKTDHYRVERGAFIPVERVPVDASSRMDNKLMDALEPFDYSALTPFAMQYLSGHHAESYDEDAEQCRPRFEERVNRAIEQTMRGMVQGYATVQVRSMQSQVAARRVVYAMLPVWTVTASYKNKPYTFAMNGQTGKIVGKLPIAWGKVALWFGAIAVGAGIIGTLGVMFL